MDEARYHYPSETSSGVSAKLVFILKMERLQFVLASRSPLWLMDDEIGKNVYPVPGLLYAADMFTAEQHFHV